MTNYNSSVLPSTPQIYEHPWYTAQSKLESSITSELESTQNQPKEVVGQKPTSKPCRHCGAPSRVLKDKKTKSGWTTNQVCNDCSWLWTQYRIRKPEYERMLVEQDHKCKICGVQDGLTKHEKLCVDHDHDTGQVRGLLCNHCNRGLGLFGDNLQTLINAVEYKQKWTNPLGQLTSS